MTTLSYPPAPRNGRPDSAAWIAAKAAGDSAEMLLADMLRDIGLAVRRTSGMAAHDLDLAGRIEVKHDRQAARTGRVAIELSHAGRHSGIRLATAAACWVLITDAEIIVIGRDTLRRLIDSGRYPIRLAAESNTVALIPLPDQRAAGIAIERPDRRVAR